MLGEYLSCTRGGCITRSSGEGNVAEAEVDRARPLLWALDFNVDPMCSVVAQVDGDRVRVLDEIVLSRATTYAGLRGV